MRWKTSQLAGWGRNRIAESQVARPERIDDAPKLFADVQDRGIIAFGGGRSYGDAALNDSGHVIRMERLNRLLQFDAETGELVAEPGVTFKDLLDVFLPRGFIVPASPGTAFTTIGGAIANDIHGKNHDVVGSFGDHVKWIELLLPSGDIVRVSPTEQADLFDATIGGIGLTGLILAACIKLIPVSSPFVLSKERRIADLESYVQAFLELEADEMTYSVGWIDALAGGTSLGRGILEVARAA